MRTSQAFRFSLVADRCVTADFFPLAVRLRAQCVQCTPSVLLIIESVGNKFGSRYLGVRGRGTARNPPKLPEVRNMTPEFLGQVRNSYSGVRRARGSDEQPSAVAARLERWPRRPAWGWASHICERRSREVPGRRQARRTWLLGAATAVTSGGSAGGHVCCLDPQRPTSKRSTVRPP